MLTDFRGSVMNINKSMIKEYFQTVKDALLTKKTATFFSISYKVVWNLFLVFIVIGLIGVSFAGGAGAGYFASLVKNEPLRSYESMKKDIYNYEESTELYFANNVFLGKSRSDLDREEIKLEDISPYVIDAVIATEDQYFYEHNGVVPKAILRALLQEVLNMPTQTGGSTLTQQLIKNQILSSEVSFERKAKEILLALRLEQFFEKDEILETYLNMATFGRNSSGANIAGVQTAAKGIFGVEAKDLNLAQAAFIGGLPQSPSRYTPFKNDGTIKENIEPGMTRMKIVLNRMLSAGKITKDQYNEALAFDLKASFAPPKESPIENYPWLTEEIEERAAEILAYQLAEKDGYESEDLDKDKELKNSYTNLADTTMRQNGYRIHSTIDKEIYDIHQIITKEYQYYGSDKVIEKKNDETGEIEKIIQPVEVGAVLLENKTGRIISFVGGRDHKREAYNHALTDAPRQNGSTMKPLAVYAPAMEFGAVQPGSIIADVNVDYWASNFSNKHYGLVTVRESLAESHNIPAARTYEKILSQRPASYLDKMGFSSLQPVDYEIPSLSLGGMTVGVTVEENTNAYATFANGGKFVDAYLIEKIETKDGEVLYQHKSQEVEVFSPQTAYLTIDMMRDVLKSGTAAGVPSKLKFSSDFAGKTGTSTDYKDAWFVASNPNITFGLWIGYDQPMSLERSYKGYSYSQRNQMLWSQLMNAAYDIRPEFIKSNENFNMPGGIVSRSYCKISGLLPSELCQEAGLVATDLFNAKFVPTKVDDTLEKGKYIVIGDKVYRALPNSPAEFTQEGVMIKKSFLEENNLANVKDLMELIPKGAIWENIVVPEDEMIQENGAVPTPVDKVSIGSGKLSWARHSHNDIIGYRIYRADNYSTNFVKVGSITVDQLIKNGGFPVNSTVAAYYVTAVDLAGRESAPSQHVLMGDWQKEKPADPPPIEPPIIPDPPEPPGDGGKKKK